MPYPAIGLAFAHQLLEPASFRASTAGTVHWWTLWLFAFGAFVGGRIVLPVWRNAYHRFRVAAVVPESDGVVSVHVTGHRLERLPVRALLEEHTAGDVVVLYRVRSAHDAALVDEVRHLVAARGGRLHLLTGASSAGVRPFEPGNLHALVPDVTERDVYVCGPPSMTAAVLDALRTLKVPARQVHAEKFSLA